MKGSMRRRGERSWELKFDRGTDENGKRKIEYRSFKGTRQEAEAKLAEFVAQLPRGEYVSPSKRPIVEVVGAWIDMQFASRNIGQKTRERCRELLSGQISKLGNVTLHQIADIKRGDTLLRRWHAGLLDSGLSPRTIHYAHQLLRSALKEAKRVGDIARNPAAEISSPSVGETEVNILEIDQVDMVMGRLAERNDELRPIVACAIYAGLRRGEVLALRWAAVDLERKKLTVAEALEELRDGTITVKQPKTKAGRRTITMPDELALILRAHRLAQLELRMKIGLGKPPNDALLFSDLDGNHLSPNAISLRWGAFADKIAIPDVTFHALRHTQASLLHHAGVPLAVVSKRPGHSKISTTLNLYTHIFADADDEAATALNGVLSGPKK
jgi:integrase